METRSIFMAVVGLSFIQPSYQQDFPQDVVFIVDHSGAIRSSSPQNNLDQNWNLMKTFLNNLLGQMRYGVPNTQLATVTYGDSSTVAFNLNSYPNVNDASNANLNLDYMNGGWSNVSGAFRTVTDVILASGNGKRTGVPSICFLIVAFPPVIDADQTATERERLEAICRLIILVVGDPNRLSVLRNEYQNYVSNSATDYFETAFSTLNNTDTVTPIINSITALYPTVPTPSTTTTTSTTASSTTFTTASTTLTMCTATARSSITVLAVGIGLGVSCGVVIFLLLGIFIYLCVKNRSLSQYKRVVEKESKSQDGRQGQNENQTAAYTSAVRPSSTQYEIPLTESTLDRDYERIQHGQNENQTAADTSAVRPSSTQYEIPLTEITLDRDYERIQPVDQYDNIIIQETESTDDYI